MGMASLTWWWRTAALTTTPIASAPVTVAMWECCSITATEPSSRWLVTPWVSGFGATSVAVADLNGDGKLDLIVAGDCSGGGCVGVLLGNGDGTFQAELSSNYSGGLSALSVAVADVNGDGKPDVVVANQCGTDTCTSSNVGVLLGNGDGTFQAATSPDSGGLFADWIAIADVNRDGKPDVIVANSSTSSTDDLGNVGVLLGNGNGTFQNAVAYPSGAYGAASVAVADVNGDGLLDLVVANCSSTASSCSPAGRQRWSAVG